MTATPRTTFCGELLVLTLLLFAGGYGQARPAAQAAAPRPQLSEEAFKNVTVLRGIPVKEFMATMGFFAASLSLNRTRLPRVRERERLGQ